MTIVIPTITNTITSLRSILTVYITQYFGVDDHSSKHVGSLGWAWDWGLDLPITQAPASRANMTIDRYLESRKANSTQ